MCFSHPHLCALQFTTDYSLEKVQSILDAIPDQQLKEVQWPCKCRNKCAECADDKECPRKDRGDVSCRLHSSSEPRALSMVVLVILWMIAFFTHLPTVQPFQICQYYDAEGCLRPQVLGTKEPIYECVPECPDCDTRSCTQRVVQVSSPI